MFGNKGATGTPAAAVATTATPAAAVAAANGVAATAPPPPVAVGAELVPAVRVEFLDAPHQTQVSLLDQVEQREPPACVLIGNTHDQPEVGAGELLPRPLSRALHPIP